MTQEASISRTSHFIKIAAWVTFGFLCLLMFTLYKLPDERIGAYVDSTLSNLLGEQGIAFSAGKSHVALGMGLSYVMKDVKITLPNPHSEITPEITIDKVAVSPSLLGLLLGKTGGTIWLHHAGGKVGVSFSSKKTHYSLSFDANDVDLSKLGIPRLLSGVSGGAVLSGKGSLSGDTSVPTATSGSLSVQLSKLNIDQQSIMGFSVPQLTVSEAISDIEIDKGKATIKSMRVGKPGNSVDDIQASVTGDVTLSRQITSSTLNLKVNFTLSQKIMKAFTLLDALLSSSKQADGSYSYQITGPAYSPNPAPVPKGGS